MMSNRGQSPSGSWYRQQPVDRNAVGMQKIEQLQRQINSMQDDMQERQRLIDRLTRLQELEDAKKGLQDKVIGRNSPVNRLLQEEMERLYGRESVSGLDTSKTPVDRNVIEKVIQHRTKEFSAKQQEAALQAKYLDKERQRLQEARKQILEQRRMLLNSISPSEHIASPRQREVRGVDSLVQQTANHLPEALDKIFQMRSDLEKHYLFYRKPYNGELGIDSYERWQIPDYAMCREIVNDVVEDFLNLYFKHDDVVEKGTYKALLDEEEKWMSRQSEALSEKRAIQLISEELFLDETSAMITDVINEMYHLYGSFRNMTDGMLMETAEMVSTGQQQARDPGDKTYDLVTKGYFSAKQNRNRHRKEVWGHSQYAQNKLKKREITRKKEGYVEPQEEEEEEEELDAPDMTLLDFNNLSPVQLRGLPPSSFDAPDVRLDKEYFQRYSRRELEYWSNMYASILHVDIAKRCQGIRIVRPSPNHRYVAVGTYHGDLFVLDALMRPWRPFKALLNSANTEQYALSISWSLDSSRLIVINDVGYLQVLLINGGPTDPDHAKKIGLKPDDKGMYAQQLKLLLELDVENQDFIFHQGTLAEEKAQDDVGLIPVRAAFFPSISFIGIQNDIVVALSNGDVLKCNFQGLVDGNADLSSKGQVAKAQTVKGQNSPTKSPASRGQSKTSRDQNKNETSTRSRSQNESQGQTKVNGTEGQGQKNAGEKQEEDEIQIETTKIYHPLLVPNTEAVDVNTIGQDVEAELLRGHKNAVIYISFVNNLNAMITVDTKGYVNQWKYSLKYKSSFGWFTPSRKYKIETNKLMYKEIGTDKPKVIFTDKTAPGKKPRTRQEVAAGRRRVQNTLDNMQLGDPWHEEFLEEEQMLVQVYAPRGNISESGAMFHIVYRHPKTNVVSTYLTRLYRPLKVKSTRIVRVVGSPTGTALVFILLFNKYPPKCAHYTIFVLDLTVMELRDFRKDIPITDEEYALALKKNIMSCDISRVYGSTGTDYLFIMFQGKLRGISLLTGQEIFRVDKPHPFLAEPDGCTLDEKELTLPVDAACTCLGFEGSLYCMAYARKFNRLSIIKFDDRNMYEIRRAMWKSYSILSDHKVVPVEQRVNTFSWALDDILHPAVAARKILMKKIDTEMRKAGLIRDHPKKLREFAFMDKLQDYWALEKAVSQSGLLEKEGEWTRRAGSGMGDIEELE